MAGTEENPIIYPDLVMPENVERLPAAAEAVRANAPRPKFTFNGK